MCLKTETVYMRYFLMVSNTTKETEETFSNLAKHDPKGNEFEYYAKEPNGVARDDLPDGGAWLYAETARQIHELSPGTGVELLVPDFKGGRAPLEEVFSSRPEVFGHNLETVPRIFKRIRPAFRYDRSSTC